MFQCPKRAIFISTVPFWTPHKYWLCRLVFAGIYQNILISSIFHPFSGMFIFCSYFPHSMSILYIPRLCNESIFPRYFYFSYLKTILSKPLLSLIIFDVGGKSPQLHCLRIVSCRMFFVAALVGAKQTSPNPYIMPLLYQILSL